MSEWREIAEIADTNPESLGAGTDPDYRFRYIDLRSVEEREVDWGSLREFRFIEAPGRARRKVRPGDVLFGTVRPNLRSHGYVPERQSRELVASTGFSVIRARDGISDGKYLSFAVLGQEIYAQSINMAVGSNYPAVNDRDVRRFRIFAPPLREQSKIAEILDTLDTQIRQTEALIAKLERVKQGLLTDLLTRGMEQNGQLRPTPDQAPYRYKDSSLGWIPREWDVVCLGELLNELGQGWSPDCLATPAADGEWGILKTTAVTWTCGYDESANKALPPHLTERPNFEVEAGDVLVTRAGPSERVGVVAYVNQTRRGLMISDKLYRLRIQQPHDPAFIALALSSSRMQRYIAKTISGMAESQTNISQAVVRSIPVILPKPEEQSQIVQSAVAINHRIVSERLLENKLQKYKSGLMDDLLTGRVRVSSLLEAKEQATA